VDADGDSAAAAVKRSFLALAFVVWGAIPVAAQLAEEKTKGLRVVYVHGGESFLPHATSTTLDGLAVQKRLFGYEPLEDLTLLMLDLADTGNGETSSVPHDLVRIQVAPLDLAFGTIPAHAPVSTILNHELVHLATVDRAAGRERAFRRLFGGKVVPTSEQPESILYFYLTAARAAAPRWYQEGIAVFVETWMAGGAGRAQGGYDEMVFRTLVRDGATFHDPLGLVSEGTKVDFQLEMNSYLYGTRFMTWLAYRYSPEHVIAWTSRTDGSRAYYSAQFARVFGVALADAWKSWIADERSFQAANLAAVRQHPVTMFRDVTPRALGSVSRAYFDPVTNRLYAAFNYPGVAAHLGAIDTHDGRIERLAPITGPLIYAVASLAWNPDDRVLFYTTGNGSWRDLVRFDVDTGEARLLQRDIRVGDLVYSRTDGVLWGIRRANGICMLVRMPRPHTTWQEVASWPYGTVVYDLDVSPDGETLTASFGGIGGEHEVRLLSVDALARGNVTPMARFGFEGSVPNGFTFSADGRYLYGTSYYTGVSNVFRYDVAGGTLDTMSNTETGFFRPVPVGGDRLLVFRYTEQGFVPSWIDAGPVSGIGAITFLGERVAALHPVLDTWNVGATRAIDYALLPKVRRPYRPARALQRESFFPIVQGYKGTAALGPRFNWSDPLQLNRASLAVSFTPGRALPSGERFHVDGEYQRYDWRVHASLNRADFYDLFGPTKTGRKGYDIGIGRTQTLVFDESRRLTLDVDAGLFGNLDRVPEYQNVAVNLGRLAAVTVRLASSDLRNSLGAVDEETGTKWTLRGDARYADGAFAPRVHADFARGVSLPAGHSSIWFRQWAGFSPGSREPALGNFYFGRFGNNYVDTGNEKRYRAGSAFPGGDLNGVSGRNFVKSMVELNLPPVRFARAGTPGFHATWMRPALFTTVLVTNLDASSARRALVNAGAQVDFRLSVLSVLEATVSAGVAVAFERGHVPQREAMVSLKLLR
jgi:hypothetical protein